MTDFVSSNNNSAETTSILNDGNTVDLLQSFVNNTSTTNVSESFKLNDLNFNVW